MEILSKMKIGSAYPRMHPGPFNRHAERAALKFNYLRPEKCLFPSQTLQSSTTKMRSVAARSHGTSWNCFSLTVESEAPLDLTTFRPAVLNYPYPPAMNPHYSQPQTSEWFHNWLLKVEVDKVVSQKMLQNFITMDAPLLCAYSYPGTDLGQWAFEWVSKYCGMVLIVDDIADKSEMGKNPKELFPIMLDMLMITMWTFPDDSLSHTNLRIFLDLVYSEQECGEMLNFVDGILADARMKRGTVYPREIMKECKCFEDLWMDALPRTPPETMLLIAHCTQYWLLGVLKEARTRNKDQSINSIQDYIDIRQLSAALYPFALGGIEMINGLNSPRYWIDSPEYNRCLMAATDLIAWDNDIWSFMKEALVDENITFNMVGAVSKFKGVNYGQASEITLKMLYDRTADLDAYLVELGKITPPELMHNFHVHRDGLRYVVAGCHKYYMESPRYHNFIALLTEA